MMQPFPAGNHRRTPAIKGLFPPKIIKIPPQVHTRLSGEALPEKNLLKTGGELSKIVVVKLYNVYSGAAEQAASRSRDGDGPVSMHSGIQVAHADGVRIIPAVFTQRRSVDT